MPSPSHRRGWAWLPSFAVWIVLILAAGSSQLAPRGALPAPAEALGWCLVATLAALHRPLGEDALGGATLGLGTLALPAALHRLGPLPGALLAGAAFLLAETALQLARRRKSATSASGDWLLEALERTSLVMGAALAAGAVAAPRWGSETLPASGGWSTLPPLAYLVVLLLLVLVVRALRHGAERAVRADPAELPPFVVDLAGWAAGFLVLAVAGLGWGPAWLVAGSLALLAAEAARQALLLETSELRTAGLERLQKAHQRILTEMPGLAAIAQQVLVECRNILPVGWFQFDLAEGDDGTSKIWSAGPDGELDEGEARPDPRPRTLPGVHRRVSWEVVEHPLDLEGELLATLRLWCDPRRIEAGAEELLTKLVPQMASSLYRAKLDREARLDPLTEVPVRRILETRLQKAFRDSCEAGTPFAVVMCDIDYFKRINDTYGHAAGDEALKLFAQTLDRHRREGDLCCRYGGEEFTLLLERTHGEDALNLAERLRRAVEALELEYEGQAIPLTFSAGVAAFPELHIKTAGELLLLADEALYAAKEQGRNRVLLHLGRGAFRGPTGSPAAAPAPAKPRTPEAPRFFG